MNNNKHYLFSEKKILGFIKSWWWVFLFIGVCYLLYAPLILKKERLCLELLTRVETLQKQTDFAREQQEYLKLRIASQSDPCFIEMILMRSLGVVPEGQVKIHFDSHS